MKKIEANDPLAQSADLVGENIAQLRQVFPEAFVEGKIDFDVLKQLLGGAVEEREERYGLNWHGKRAARQLAYAPSTATLRPLREKSLRWDETRNVLIEGENLETLKVIHRSLSQRIDFIYIDPPYNTGRNDLVYRDSFTDGFANYQKTVGRIDESGQATTSEKDGGHTHTNWLKMILPRLTLAKQLLADDGLMLVSIDDREFAGLRLVLDEIFGQENCLAVFSWRRTETSITRQR
jgi:adenine-specific DNA-methyltransferase